ncbi:hypothetical protein BB560_001877 [Smittium megazygosporum]|uniref:Uncharacterized protein n=1 Tax=Smittium megazygosporum TaxID=133381 RepID=A0A2T9ZGC8_9FUNG|nr:hypothetical protein BB560_001877 [Smittium megazygosporum]
MGQNTRYSNGDVFGRPTDIEKIEINMCVMIGKGYLCLTVEKQVASGKEIMVSNCSSNTISNPESTVLERQFKKVESAQLYTRNSGERDFHRYKRCGMGYSRWIRCLFRRMEKILDYTTYKREGINSDKICTQTSGCERQISINILGQHHTLSLCEEVWRNNFSRAFEDSRRYLEILLNYKHTATGVIRCNFYKLGRCAKQAHSADRVVAIDKNVQSNRADLWLTQYRSFYSRPTRSGPKSLGKGIKILGKPILLSALEPNPTNNSEGSKREDYSHPNNPGLEICNLFSRRKHAVFSKPN